MRLERSKNDQRRTSPHAERSLFKTEDDLLGVDVAAATAAAESGSCEQTGELQRMAGQDHDKMIRCKQIVLLSRRRSNINTWPHARARAHTHTHTHTHARTHTRTHARTHETSGSKSRPFHYHTIPIPLFLFVRVPQHKTPQRFTQYSVTR